MWSEYSTFVSVKTVSTGHDAMGESKNDALLMEQCRLRGPLLWVLILIQHQMVNPR